MSLTAKMDTSTGNGDSKIPKFPKDREYFNPWCTRMKLFLSMRECWHVTIKSTDAVVLEYSNSLDSAISSSSSSSNTQSSSSSPSTENRNKVDEYKQKAKVKSIQAHYIIMQALHYSQYTEVQDVPDGNAYELWATINKLYGTMKTSETHASILSKIITEEKQRKQTMIEYISNKRKLITQLEQINSSRVTKMDEKYYMLNGLRNASEWQVDVNFLFSLLTTYSDIQL
jgi:hypothetical protein